MSFTFTPNADGSLTVAFNAPALTWNIAGGVGVGTYYTQHGTLPNLYPSSAGAAVHGGPVSMAIDQSGVPYTGHVAMHLQFGSDPGNTIKDLFVNVALSSSEQQVMLGSAAATVIMQLKHPGGMCAYTIPAAVLSDARAADGIYAIGYVDLVWGPLTQGDATPSGSQVIALVYGTNAPTAQSAPPTHPTDLQGSLNPDLSVALSWGQSIAGTAPLAGYRIHWGLTRGGPYTSSHDVPIAAYPPASAPRYQATLAKTFFAQDGKTRYFTVNAFDNGSAPASLNFTPAQTVTYWPAPPAIVASAPPPAGGTPVPSPVPRPTPNPPQKVPK